MYIDFSEQEPTQVYFTMTQTVIPRPIAWVLSEHANGTLNLAPFSYFNAVCSDPPLLLISVGKKPDGSPKDTRVNIEQRRDFVVHIAHRELLPQLNQSSATMPAGESEVDAAALQTTAFVGARLPRLASARIAFACRLHDIQEIGGMPQALILGRVDRAYIDDAVVSHDAKGRLKVNADRVDPLARLGASEYMFCGELATLKRPA
jgi:flavin reductase (DIM6/NTAB) family NADH-FMN oxidoreductase RutF